MRRYDSWMLALTFTDLKHAASDRLRLVDRPPPEIQYRDDVLVRVTHAGICGTDIHIALGGHPATPGVTLGHEIAGIIERAGPDARFAPGTHVVIDPNLACADAPLQRPSGPNTPCPACMEGIISQCEWMAAGNTIGIFRNGGFAVHVVAPSGAVHAVPGAISGRSIAVLAEPLSCIENSLRRLHGMPIRRALVLGGGPMGALYAMRLVQCGAEVAVSEAGAARRSCLAEILGKHAKITAAATETGSSDRGAAVEWARSLFDSRPPDLVVDAVGRLTALALRLVRPGGAVVQLGMDQRAGPAAVDAYELVRREKRLIGSYIGKGCFPAALEALARGLRGAEHLVRTECSLAEALVFGFSQMGFEASRGTPCEPSVLKAIVRMA